MITGSVNANREAAVRLCVRGPEGKEETVVAVIDTGFTGYITLPASLVASLDLAWLGRQQGVLGDGSVQPFDVFSAWVNWDGEFRVVEVDSAETVPLVGMGLLYGYELRIQSVDGGLVSIEALP